MPGMGTFDSSEISFDEPVIRNKVASSAVLICTHRMRLLKVIAAMIGIVAACGSGIELFLRFHKPFPDLAAGLPDIASDAEREFDRRVKERFPVGSSEVALRTVLKQDGWGEPIAFRDMYYVSFSRAPTLVVEQKATIVWRVDEKGRLTEIRGRYGLTGL